MNLRVSLAAAAAFLLPALGSAQILSTPYGSAADAFQINYASNLNLGDGVVNITNAGTSAGATTPVPNANTAGDICANVYVYAPDQELASCCSCLVSPNSLHSWPVSFGPGNLLQNVANSNVLNSIRSGNNSVVIKLLATAPLSGTTCNPAAPGTALVSGMAAWATHSHPTNTPTVAITETPFEIRGLSLGEFNKLTGECSSIVTVQSGQFCPGCRLGGLSDLAPSL